MMGRKGKSSPTGELSPDEVLLKKYFDRAKVQKKLPAEVAVEARRCYGGTPENALSTRAPVSHNNFFKKAVKIHKSKCISGSPTVKILGEKGDAATTHLNGVFGKESFVTLLQSVVTDVIMFGGGYVMVHDATTLEYLYWFDVFADNALATPRNIFDGRWVFIRRLVDAEVFWDTYSDSLKEKFGLTSSEGLNRASEIEGRLMEGFMTQIQLTPMETKASDLQLRGVPLDQGKYSTAGVLDGLVEEWECYLAEAVDEDDDKRWSACFMYNGKIIVPNGETEEKIYLPDNKPLPGIVYWPRDYLGGQFYQPSLYKDIIHSQAAYNYMNGKDAQIYSMLDNPSFTYDIADSANVALWENTPGEGLGLTNPSAFKPIDQPVPPPEMRYTKEYIKKDLETDSGVTDVTTGIEPTRETSGIALARMQRGADIYFEDLVSGRDEFLGDVARELVSYMDGVNVPPDARYEFKIIPKMSEDEKWEQTLMGIQTAGLVVQGTILETDPLVRCDIAGLVTGNLSQADAMKEILKGYLEGVPDPAMQDDAAKEADHERAIEEKHVDGEIKLALEEAKNKNKPEPRSTGRR